LRVFPIAGRGWCTGRIGLSMCFEGKRLPVYQQAKRAEPPGCRPTPAVHEDNVTEAGVECRGGGPFEDHLKSMVSPAMFQREHWRRIIHGR
jgi:hypothetical protein